MEKLFWKASAGILEEPPSPAGRGMLQQGSQGRVPPKLHGAAPAEASTPEGTARGKRAPTCAAVSPACSLPSSLPVLPGSASLVALAAKTREVPRAEGCRPPSPCS